jgi:hypothetical protein
MKQVALHTFLYRHEAEFAVGFLDDAGIASRLIGDDAAGVYPNLAISHGIRLVVAEEDAENALAVLLDAGVLAQSGD